MNMQKLTKKTIEAIQAAQDTACLLYTSDAADD